MSTDKKEFFWWDDQKPEIPSVDHCADECLIPPVKRITHHSWRFAVIGLESMMIYVQRAYEKKQKSSKIMGFNGFHLFAVGKLKLFCF